MIKTLFIALITVLAGGCAGSRVSRVGAVDGNVVEESTGTPLRFAHVRISRSESGAFTPQDNRLEWEDAHETLTLGTSARFAWHDIIPGIYFLRATNMYYEPSSVVRIKVIAGETVHVTLRLRPGTS